MWSGHIIVDDMNDLLAVDPGFCNIMRASSAQLIGRNVWDLTAPADREECALAIAGLRNTGQPFEISKRLVRADESLIWVTNNVSLVRNAGGRNILVATISPMAESPAERAPARLLNYARMMVTARMDRRSVLAHDLSTDLAWDVILAIYIAEAEGKAITTTGLAEQLGMRRNQADRWITLLLSEGAIEIETRKADSFSPKSFRLTAKTHSDFETHLANMGKLRTDMWQREWAA
jgi:PAS domain S-box-containing protein